MVEKVAVIGAGTMGNGIAHVFALGGFNTTLIDISESSLEKGVATIHKNLQRQLDKEKISAEELDAATSNLSSSSTLEAAASADLVVEAIIEDLEVKKKVFSELDKLCGPETILASNTSSISLTQIASATQRPDKVIGMHFMNPVPVMKLVEVICGYETSDATTSEIVGLSKKLGKVPVEVNDYPGFISNRILMPMINEAICALFEGVSSVEGIDTVMKLGMAHPMGPLQLADFIGLDVCLSIMEVLYSGYGNPKYAPCPLLVNMVAAKQLGVKSGSGFYDWSHGTKELIVAARFK